MLGRYFSVDPYFSTGLVAAVLLGATFMWKTRTPQTVVLERVPVGLLGSLDSAGIAYSQGKPGSPVHVVEISDYQCPACATAHRATKETLERYVGQGLVYYTAYDVPLPSHTNAYLAALLVSCTRTGLPVVTSDVRSILFKRQAEWSEVYPVELSLLELAAQVGADTASIRSCMNQEGTATMKRIRAAREAVSSFGINFTPLWLVNGKVIRWDRLDREIELAQAAQ